VANVEARALGREHAVAATDLAEHALQSPHVQNAARHELQPQAGRYLQRLADHRGRAEISAVVDEPDATHGRRERLEQLQALGDELALQA